MGDNLNPNTARVGLNLDATTSQIQQGELSYALNAVISGFDGRQVTYQNEQATELCALLAQGYSVICAHPIIEKDMVVFFLVNTATGASEIGYVNTLTCIYTTSVNTPCLNFSIDYPIKKAVHKITSCGIEVYWTDNYNGRRYIDLLNLPFVEDITGCNTNQTQQIDCNQLLIQPNFDIPQISYDLVNSEGQLVAGSYQFAVQYSNSLSDPYTSYYSITNPLPVNNPLIVSLAFNYVTNTAIQLTVTNIDTSGIYDYYNLAVIKTINDIVSVELVGTYQIENTTDTVIYTGQNQTSIRLTADDIFEKFAAYDLATDVTTVQDILIWTGLTTEERISWQQIANQITLTWATDLIPPSSGQYKDALIAANYKGYFRDEVYAFEICPLYTNGYQADSFHIPGRAALSYDTELVNNPDVVSNTDPCDPTVGGVPRWQVYNTATSHGFFVENPDDCYLGPYQFGTMGYWESTETYPCNTDVWGALAGKPIRHHQMPDNTVTNHFDSNGNIYPLGLQVDVSAIWSLITNSTGLTAAQKSKIAGFKIVRGNRANNKSVKAKGILYNVGKYTREGTTYYYPNYPYNDLRVDPFILAQSNTPIQTSLSSGIVTTSSIGSSPTQLGTTQVPYTNIFQGYQIIYNGTFQGMVGPRRIQVFFASGDPAIPNLLPVFDSGIIQEGAATAWSLNVQIIYSNTANNGEWGVSVITSFTIFAATNQTKNNSFAIGLPGNSNLTGTLQVIGTGVNNGDIVLNTGVAGGTDITNIPVTNPLNGFSDSDSQQRFTFHSPDTSFYQPVLGDILKLDEILYGSTQSHFVEVKNHAKYKFPSLGSYLTALAAGVIVGFASGLYGTSDQPFDGTAAFTTIEFLDQLIYTLIPRKNFAYQFNSVGTYNQYFPISNDLGIKNRFLDIAAYIIPGYLSVGDTYEINNWEREGSVYLRTTETLPYPSDNTVYPSISEDASRTTLSENANCGIPNSVFSTPICSYYGAIKEFNLNQYGQIYSYDTIDTGSQFLLSDTGVATVYGGDCYINNFSFKRKLPFFLDNRVAQPDDSDVFYDTLGNIGYPTYWFSTDIQKGTGGNFNVGELFGVKVNNFDCNDNNFFYESGKFYLFAYGIPTFFCESEINVDYRQAYNDREGEYYPHVSQGIPDDWLQEIRVPIINDNTYIYNKSYSKQNDENEFTHLPIDFIPNQNCIQHLPNRSVYSDKQYDVINYKRNNWRIYRPASYFDFPLNYGNLTSLEGIENREIIARFENKSQIYNRLLTINTSDPKAAYLGNPEMFATPPVDFLRGDTDIGYNGSQHTFFLKTEFGNVSVDARRGNVYLMTSSYYGHKADDITAKGLNAFFSLNLPFQMQKAFPGYDIDNIWKGVGLSGTYESKYKRIIITKLDYKPIIAGITYDSTLDQFSLNGQQVFLWDRQYFCNVSWTLSYSFLTQTWVSFHTYLPNYYAASGDYFFSGTNPEGMLWRHNSNILNYNQYYGLTQPYIIEYPFNYKQMDEVVQSFRDYSKVIKQIDEKAYIQTDNIYFDQCIIYNDQQCSGIRNLVYKQPGNMPQTLQYPKYNGNSIDILFTKSNNCYNINEFWDVSNLQSLPLFTKSCVALSYDKIVNQANMIYQNQSYKKPPIQAKDSKVRLILNSRNDVRIVSEFAIEESQTSIK